MSDLAVTRALTALTNPTESQFDSMRTDLITFFTGALLDEDNIAAGSMEYSSLSNPGDAEDITWDQSWATMQYDDGANKFKIANTEGDILFAHKVDDTTLIEFFSVRESDGALEVFGILQSNTSTGSQIWDTQTLLARYRKPRLSYSTADIVTVESNASDGNTYVMGRDRLWKIYDTTCSLAVDANGETALDTGTAVSGLGASVVRTDDRWFYIYAVEVTLGTQADGINAILVANKLPPISSNIAALDTAFTAGKWVYMGLVRNGYNIASNRNVIVPFINDECGYHRFTQALVDNDPIGVRLATVTDTSNLVYAVDFGNDQVNTIPEVATRVIFGGTRDQYGFELQYVAHATSEINMITTGCEHVTDLVTLQPALYIEVPALDGYDVYCRVGNSNTTKRITLAGLVDHYV